MLPRWGQVIDLLEAAYGTDAATALCEHLLFTGSGGGGNGAAAECNGAAGVPEQREAKLREATLKCVDCQFCNSPVLCLESMPGASTLTVPCLAGGLWVPPERLS